MGKRLQGFFWFAKETRVYCFSSRSLFNPFFYFLYFLCFLLIKAQATSSKGDFSTNWLKFPLPRNISHSLTSVPLQSHGWDAGTIWGTVCVPASGRGERNRCGVLPMCNCTSLLTENTLQSILKLPFSTLPNVKIGKLRIPLEHWIHIWWEKSMIDVEFIQHRRKPFGPFYPCQLFESTLQLVPLACSFTQSWKVLFFHYIFIQWNIINETTSTILSGSSTWNAWQWYFTIPLGTEETIWYDLLHIAV